MALSQFLLDIIACPKCKGNLVYNELANQLICNTCKLSYRVEDDIPIMLIEEARALED